jgi:beta-galactosidase
MHRFFLYILYSAIFLVLMCNTVKAQPVYGSKESAGLFNSKYVIKGKGICSIENGVLLTKDAYALFGEESWADYEIRFSARTPVTEKQVQIWAGFRAYNINDRYVLGFRGGNQNSLYFARMGYMGTDEFLGLRMLDFKPKTGEWYNFRILVSGNHFQIFLNNENLPRIDVSDTNSNLAPSGKITLGGGWLKTEYKDLSVSKLSAQNFNQEIKEYADTTTVISKEKKRVAERAAYHPLQVKDLAAGRTEISLNGQWLFMPGYQLSDQGTATSPITKDDDWHVMTVPSFWNPIRIWLHGETFGIHSKGASDNYFQMETDRCEGYTFDYKKTSFAWYRQWIELPENITEKNTELVFDAVSKVAEVWINGEKAGEHTGMFGEMRIDGKSLFRPGKNLVVVKVTRDYSTDIKDAAKVVDVAVSVEVTNKMLKDLAHGFYNGDPAGIWKPVSLIITNSLKVQNVFIKPDLTGAQFDVTLKNNDGKASSFYIATDIKDNRTGAVLVSTRSLINTEIKPGEEKIFSYSVNNLKPKLWSPQSPNLYDFTFHIISDNKELDATTITSGFRTFQSKDGYLWLNGKRYWLRGANHTPFALAPNNKELADSFFQIMKRGNIEVTRTHTSPWNELWMDAADRNGIGVSFEGTWPWLMLNTSMPDAKLINLWAEEFLALLKKYRNHPSLLIWTVNNEMKFYDNDPDIERAKIKMKIISDVVKRMRKVDSTRPIVFDSNYKRDTTKFGRAFYSNIDDGDIDDKHAYINWYNHSLFRQFKGEFQKENKNEGRPLISQEMSTGYPNNETGHATRFYTIIHQNPQSLIGNLAYENADPANFLKVQSFITGELAEAFRRSNEQASGILHFALLTWFRNVYDPKKIEPYPAYYAMKRALSPVLVSAELWGRHFYTGEKLPVRICVVNDQENGKELSETVLTWKLLSGTNEKLASGKINVPSVQYYGRQWLFPEINIPLSLPTNVIDARLELELTENNKLIASNEYNILLAKKSWSQLTSNNNKHIVLVDFNKIKSVFSYLNIQNKLVSSVNEAVKVPADLYVFSGLNTAENCSDKEIQQIRDIVRRGGKILLLNSESASKAIFPEYVTGWITDAEGDIANPEIPESIVFDGIAPLQIRYFNNNKREEPVVCNTSLKINRNPDVEALASHIKIHGYINGGMEQRRQYMETIKGFPIIKIKNGGTAIVSTLLLDKALTDPIAGRLLSNMLKDLLK